MVDLQAQLKPRGGENKGPHITAAVRALDDSLRRMEGHQHKKRSMLLRLHLADGLPATSAGPDDQSGGAAAQQAQSGRRAVPESAG